MDLAKTQFLFETGAYITKVRTFRRKRMTALVDRTGKPLRLMEHDDWLRFKKDWSKEIESDGVRLATIWTLIEVAGTDGGTRTRTALAEGF